MLCGKEHSSRRISDAAALAFAERLVDLPSQQVGVDLCSKTLKLILGSVLPLREEDPFNSNVSRRLQRYKELTWATYSGPDDEIGAHVSCGALMRGPSCKTLQGLVKACEKLSGESSIEFLLQTFSTAFSSYNGRYIESQLIPFILQSIKQEQEPGDSWTQRSRYFPTFVHSTLAAYIDSIGWEPGPLEAPELDSSLAAPYCPSETCHDCESLSDFLMDSTREEWRFIAAAKRRMHLTRQLRSSRVRCDTYKLSTPHILEVVKWGPAIRKDHEEWDSRRRTAEGSLQNLSKQASFRRLLGDRYDEIMEMRALKTFKHPVVLRTVTPSSPPLSKAIFEMLTVESGADSELAYLLNRVKTQKATSKNLAAFDEEVRRLEMSTAKSKAERSYEQGMHAQATSADPPPTPMTHRGGSAAAPLQPRPTNALIKPILGKRGSDHIVDLSEET